MAICENPPPKEKIGMYLFAILAFALDLVAICMKSMDLMITGGPCVWPSLRTSLVFLLVHCVVLRLTRESYRNGRLEELCVRVLWMVVGVVTLLVQTYFLLNVWGWRWGQGCTLAPKNNASSTEVVTLETVEAGVYLITVDAGYTILLSLGLLVGIFLESLEDLLCPFP